MSRRRKKRKKKSRDAEPKRLSLSTAELMLGILGGIYVPMMRPQDARSLMLYAPANGFEDAVGEDLSHQSTKIGLMAVGELLAFIGVVASAVMSIGWWAVLAVLGTLAGSWGVRSRGLFLSQEFGCMVTIVIIGAIVAAFLVFSCGLWHAALAIAIPLVWFFRLLSYRYSTRYVDALTATNPAAFNFLFGGGELALVDMEELKKAADRGDSIDYLPLITAHDLAEHD